MKKSSIKLNFSEISNRTLGFNMFSLFFIGFLMGCVHHQPESDLKNDQGSFENYDPSGASKNNRFDWEKKILVIGHRGASGYLPEHTLESYQLAMDQGADFIEPDLVSTKDGVLVARHENNITETTNVSVMFPEKKTTKIVDGQKVTGWFVEDFTLKEIKSLRARQRLPNRSQLDNDKYLIPTFDEILELVIKNNNSKKTTTGVYPETKHPSYFRGLNIPIEEKLVESLKKYGYNEKGCKVYIQSFEIENLKKLKRITPVRLIQLIGEAQERPFDHPEWDYGQMLSLDGLKKIAKYADGIGPYKKWLIEDDDNKNNQGASSPRPSDIFKNAKLVGLKIHPYTFRNESYFLLKNFKNPVEEYTFFYKIGVDGVFSDFPDTAVKARSN